jgi:TIMELESS-interacting protein
MSTKALNKLDRIDFDVETQIINKKKRVRSFKPFDEDMLIGANGLTSVYESFHLKCLFHGRGSETRDLKNLIKQYKLWAFNLHPGTNVQDLLNKCESMGKNKKVKTSLECLRIEERQRYLSAAGIKQKM